MRLDIKPAKAQSQYYFIYLPLVSIENQCGFTTEELTFADNMINDPDQQRAFMVCDPILAQMARECTFDMGTRNYFNHTNQMVMEQTILCIKWVIFYQVITIKL